MAGEDVFCDKCKEKCTKDYVRALGGTFHTSCFVCKSCSESLAGKAFFEHEGAATCKECFEKECAPKCHCCGEGILGDVTTALGKTWKPEHFVCTHCKKAFSSGDGFLERDDLPYCKPDYYDLFKPKCSKCSKPITDATVTALERKWHQSCFVCSYAGCDKPFPGGRFYVVDDRPFCLDHCSGDKEKPAEDA